MPGPSRSDVALAEIMAAVRATNRDLAIELAKQAWRGGVQHPLVLMLAAEGLAEEGDPLGALDALRAATTLERDEPELWKRYAVSLASQDMFEEAHLAVEEALDLDPDDRDALKLAGAVSFQAGKMGPAHAYYLRASRLAPGDGETLAARAAVALRQGHIPEARSLAGQALAIRPGDISATLTLVRADLQDGRAEDARVSASEVIIRPDAGDEHLLAALDLRAQALDALDRPAEAYGDYNARNAISARLAAPSVAVLPERRIDQAQRLAQVFGQSSSAWTSRPPGPTAPGQPIRAPVFLLGFPRSGTTLLEKALACHPDVVTLEEVDHLATAGGHLLATTESLDVLTHLTQTQANACRQAYWAGVSKTLGPDIVGKVLVDKMPLHTISLPLISKLFPDARVIFALRDPRDVVLSCFRRRFRVNAAMYEFLTLQGAAAYYDAVMRLAEIYRERLPLQMLEIRHETMVRDFDAELRRVLAFIGLPWNAAVRDFAERARSRPRTPSDLQLVGGLNSDGVGQWRRFRPQMESVLDLLEPWADRFGYAAAPTD